MNKKISTKELKKAGVVLLAKDELLKVSAGDYIDCDVLLQSLLHAGYKARYENLFEDVSGFFAVFYIDDEKVGAVEMRGYQHMIAFWEGIE